MQYTKDDIDRKFKEYRALTLVKRQLEFELEIGGSRETNADGHDAINLQFSRVSTEIRRIDFYISLLDVEVAAAIRAVYFEGLSNKKAGVKLFVDARTIAKRKSLGLTALAEMYSRLQVK